VTPITASETRAQYFVFDFGQMNGLGICREEVMVHSMTRMSMVFAALLLAVSFARTQEKKIEKAPMKPTSAASGEQMYKEYCAVCHGRTGKGDGPAVEALKVPPPDLTMLARNNGGKYPADHVQAVLRLGVAGTAHGTKDMPIWGSVLGSSEATKQDPAMVQLRIFNLTKHIESMQTK
jgi:mono/diheme cytochrome c family protein